MIHALVGYANSVLEVRDSFAVLLDISGGQYEILMVVYRLHGAKPCTVTEVALQVHRTVAFVTNETNKLAARGFISKRQDAKDRRRMNLRATDACIEQLNGIAPVQRRLNDATFKNLNARDFRALCTLYEKLPACGERAAALASKYKSDSGVRTTRRTESGARATECTNNEEGITWEPVGSMHKSGCSIP